MNHVKLLFFATLRDRAGRKSMELDVPLDLTIQGLKEKLSSEFPNLKDSMKSVLITINREYAYDEAVIPQEAELAIFPPVSGGLACRCAASIDVESFPLSFAVLLRNILWISQPSFPSPKMKLI
jgi:molybdopterin converting factor subunit 1